jgi:hypothetical protein
MEREEEETNVMPRVTDYLLIPMNFEACLASVLLAAPQRVDGRASNISTLPRATQKRRRQ